MTLLVPQRRPAATAQPSQEEARPHQFTLEEYYRLAELGFFDDRRVEFIDGEILDMPPQKDSHAYCVTRTGDWCRDVFGKQSHWVRVQMTLRTAGSSPEPDVTVLDVPPSPGNSYASADRAVLVIEVADSTLLADTTSKMSLYASAGVKDYWVLSIPDRVLIVHRRPVQSAAGKHGFAYAEVRRFAAGEPVSPLAVPAAFVDPAQLLP